MSGTGHRERRSRALMYLGFLQTNFHHLLSLLLVLYPLHLFTNVRPNHFSPEIYNAATKAWIRQ